MEAQCLTLKNMLEPPKLLRRPLPPKVLPALTVQKQKPINHEEIIPSWPEEQLHEIPLLQSDGYEDDVQRLYEPAAASPLEKIKRIHEKWILDQLAATPAASPLNSADFPLNFKNPDPLRHVQTKYKYSVLDQTKERDSTMHSGPADFPSPTHHRKLPVTVLPLVNDPRYQPPPPEFTLSDIIAQSADHPKCVTEILNKPILSRQQYSNMDRLVTGLQRKKQSKVHTVVLSTSNIPEMSRRVPLQQQLILDTFQLQKAPDGPAEQQKRMSKEGGKENLTHAAEQQKEMSKEGGKENLTNAGADTLHQLLKSQYLQDSENICSEMNDDHENVFVTHCELALLESLVHGGNTLSLKAFFISRLPDLTTLRNTLLYLNLSFNEFRHFPTEIYKLENLEVLKLRNNPIKEIPFGIHNLKKLRTFIMSFCFLFSLPAGLFQLQYLQVLDVSYNSISSIPNDICNLRLLEFLNVEGNGLPALPCGALKLQLKQLLVGNNAMHPLFWRENTWIEPQRLADLAALSFIKNNVWQHVKVIPEEAKKILHNCKVCDCCRGSLYGQGLRFIRPCDKIFGIRKLPFMFHACSPSCYKSFMSQTKSLAQRLYEN